MHRRRPIPIERPALSKRFTLVELLVIVAIVAILVSLLLPALARARGTAMALACRSKQRQLAAAIMLYLGDNDGSYMPASCYLYNGNAYATPSEYWRTAGWSAPWGYWWTGAFCDLAPTGPPWAPSWMDYAFPYFETRALVKCPTWRWHRLGGCQWDGDRYQYGYGANVNVLPMWDFNQFQYDPSGESWARIPGRPAIVPSRLAKFGNQRGGDNNLPANKIMLYDRLRSDRMDTWFSNISIGGVSFHHPQRYPRPPDNQSSYFSDPATAGDGYTNAAFADGHVDQVRRDEFNGKL